MYYITALKFQAIREKSEHHPMTLHYLQGKGLASLNYMPESWQKYDFIIGFVCRFSMVSWDVYGCQVERVDCEVEFYMLPWRGYSTQLTN